MPASKPAASASWAWRSRRLGGICSCEQCRPIDGVTCGSYPVPGASTTRPAAPQGGSAALVLVIVAGAAVERVGPVAAVERVVAVAGLDTVRAGVTEHRVVAAVRPDHVIAAEAADHVVAARAGQLVVAVGPGDRAAARRDAELLHRDRRTDGALQVARGERVAQDVVAERVAERGHDH